MCVPVCVWCLEMGLVTTPNHMLSRLLQWCGLLPKLALLVVTIVHQGHKVHYVHTYVGYSAYVCRTQCILGEICMYVLF